MAEPVIVPPPPTVTQPSGPVDTSPGLEQVQRAFDQAYPERKPASPTPPAETPPVTPPPPVEPKPPPPAAETPPPAEPAERKLPSFLEEALKIETPTAPPKPAEPDAEWAEDLPQEERKSRIKGLRDAYKNVKQELETLKSRPQGDPEQVKRMAYLEEQNRGMAEVLSRFGVEQSAEFQQQVMQPLYASWNEAARIVRDAGADPNELAKAMALSGRAQFEALDNLFSEMPESAKAEAHDALRSYRRFDEARKMAIANAPKTLESLRQRETQRQYSQLNQQREDMKAMFDRAVSRLRDEAKVEVFLKSSSPETQWWNEQGDKIIEQGRSLFLENTDMDRVALACLLAPSADVYRNLFLQSQKKINELNKIIKDKIGNEPTLSESQGANIMPPADQMAEDLKQPFAQVFLREFHKSQARNR